MRIDIAAPDLLWARWGALAAALTALGHPDVYWCDADGAHHDDHGGNWARLVLVEGGRAVLFGYDHEYSDTAGLSPPLDLLAGAPGWLPWPELVRHAADDQLGYVYWYDGGHWSRVPYPESQVADGLPETAGAVLDDARARQELGEVVFSWGGHQPADLPTERAEVAVAAGRLLDAAAGGVLDGVVLAGLLGRIDPTGPADGGPGATGPADSGPGATSPADSGPGATGGVDLAAGLAVAARAGLRADGVRPVVPAAAGPPPRRIRRLSEDQHDRLVWTAMRQAEETPRPVPAPTLELTALIEWARDRAPSTLSFQVTDTSLSQHRDGATPAGRPGDDDWAAFRKAGDLVRRLRQAEADPAYGCWIFLRVAASADGVTVTRCYDSWPRWIPHEDRGGPWRSHLRPEVERRAAAYRPAWSVLLDPEVAYLGPPPPFDTLPVD
ncbi:hypothetical protein ACN28G_21765 [Micromonospora sp. WMMA1923]|uniref:hypothetical protein n=1 Tax=Micromonospora sp. WMMA1923 TaxID=3404125 RepID=UPI003B939E41